MPLAEFPIRVVIPVLWGNQDLFGHVNNCIYFRWLESARVAYWDDGLRQVMAPHDWGPILANVSCNFRGQVHYPDTIHVGAKINKVGRTSLTMEHAIYSEHADAIVADGYSIIVVFNYKSQKPARISEDLRAAIETTEARARQS